MCQKYVNNAITIQTFEMVQMLTIGINKKMSEAEACLQNKLLKENHMMGFSFDKKIEVFDHNAAFLCLDLRLINDQGMDRAQWKLITSGLSSSCSSIARASRISSTPTYSNAL
jgi:hypothetical protein